jgi:hypothetical protein
MGADEIELPTNKGRQPDNCYVASAPENTVENNVRRVVKGRLSLLHISAHKYLTGNSGFWYLNGMRFNNGAHRLAEREIQRGRSGEAHQRSKSPLRLGAGLLQEEWGWSKSLLGYRLW